MEIWASAPITVVIPTHRRPEMLQQAIDSVMAQIVLPEQIIVIEDLPSDDRARELTVAKSEEFGVPVEYVPSAGGANVSRNVGAARANTRFVAFLDDDDLWDRSFLERTLAAMTDDIDLVVTGIALFDEDGPFATLSGRAGDISRCLRRNGGLTGSNGLYVVTTLRSIGGWDESLRSCQDRDLHIRLLLDGARVVAVGEPLTKVRQSSQRTRISNSDARAVGTLQFFRAHARHGGFSDRFVMAWSTLADQRYHGSWYRRWPGTFATLSGIAWRRGAGALGRISDPNRHKP